MKTALHNQCLKSTVKCISSPVPSHFRCVFFLEHSRSNISPMLLNSVWEGIFVSFSWTCNSSWSRAFPFPSLHIVPSVIPTSSCGARSWISHPGWRAGATQQWASHYQESSGGPADIKWSPQLPPLRVGQ